MVEMSMSQPVGRRSKIAIIADILRLLRLGETGKVEIMCAGKLGYHMTRKYIALLLESGLMTEITKHPDEINYQITQKGLNFLSQIESLQEMLHVDESLDIFRRPELMEKIAEGKAIVEYSDLKES
jgi:predicted transcriptional regulator